MRIVGLEELKSLPTPFMFRCCNSDGKGFGDIMINVEQTNSNKFHFINIIPDFDYRRKDGIIATRKKALSNPQKHLPAAMDMKKADLKNSYGLFIIYSKDDLEMMIEELESQYNCYEDE